MGRISGRSRAIASLAGFLLVGMAGASGTVFAQGQAGSAFNAPSIYLEGGKAARGGPTTTSAELGVVLPFWSVHEFAGGTISNFADLYVSQWRSQSPAGPREAYTQLGAIATFRYRFSQGTSPWFADAGIGLTQMDSIYRTPEREFSTHFQFTEVLAVGRNFGDRGEHELSLRAQHFSNGSIRKPNPGENFLRVRYAYHF